MSRTRNWLLALMPSAWRTSAEAESKRWMIRCPNCQFERSVWDVGGIKWQARGEARTFGKCPSCGENVWFRVYKKD